MKSGGFESSGAMFVYTKSAEKICVSLSKFMSCWYKGKLCP